MLKSTVHVVCFVICLTTLSRQCTSSRMLLVIRSAGNDVACF